MRELVEAKGLAEVLPIPGMQKIAVLDRRDGHAFARETLLPERQKIVDGGEIVGREGVKKFRQF